VSRATTEGKDRIPFFDELAKAKKRILILDYDGTIAPFAADRRRALPYDGVSQLLREVMETCGTRLIVVSGRAVHELPLLLGLQPQPEIWGAHGIERISPDGQYEQIACSDEAVQMLNEAESLLEQQELGDYLEIKLAAVAVHWRGLAPSKGLKIRTKAYRTLESFLNHPDLVVADFEEGVEIRLRSANKGNLIRALLSDIDKSVPVAYLGDDSTDENAFRALNGRGLTVLVRPKHRFTAAQMWLKPPEDLVQFLAGWIRACRRTA
jgi:trehalose-phosphatase